MTGIRPSRAGRGRGSNLPPTKLIAYTDYAYHRRGDRVFSERAFSLFLGRVGRDFDRLKVIGRLDNGEDRGRYELPAEVEFLALPHYERLTDLGAALAAMARSVRVFWRALDGVEAVWVLGPHPLAIGFALIGKLRRRRVVLGVREDLPEYVRTRHPGNRKLLALARTLEWGFRRLSRHCPTVVVGPALADRYREASELLEIAVSLVEEADIVAPARAPARTGDGGERLLTVGRIEEEKNPLLIAEVLAELERRRPGRWRLTVCGEGPMEEALAGRLEALGVAALADLRGYLPLREGLLDLYRDSTVFLHVSLTEGLPQVLLEAFAAGTPVVATDVGGIGAALGDAVVAIPPDDVDAAVSALISVAEDDALRERLAGAGGAYVRRHTLDREADAVFRFIAGDRGRGRAAD